MRICNGSATTKRHRSRAVLLSTINFTPYSPDRSHVSDNVQSSSSRVGKSCFTVYVLGRTCTFMTVCDRFEVIKIDDRGTQSGSLLLTLSQRVVSKVLDSN